MNNDLLNSDVSIIGPNCDYFGQVIYCKYDNIIIDIGDLIIKKISNKYEYNVLKELHKLNFPFIPKIKNQFKNKDDYFIVMEKIKDDDIDITLFYELFDALKILHSHHIFHHDLHPNNILFANNQYYIIDFGCSIMNNKYNDDNMTPNDLFIEDWKFNKIYDLGQLYCSFITICSNLKICLRKFIELDTFKLTIYEKLFYICYVIEHQDLWENYDINALLNSYRHYNVIINFNKKKIIYFDVLLIKEYEYKNYQSLNYLMFNDYLKTTHL